MGTCSSKDQIQKSVVSPPRSPSRPRSNNVKVPTTSSSSFPDTRHEYSTVADHLPSTEPKDNKDDEEDDHHPFFPHEAETPEALSPRSSTDNEKRNTDGKVHASATFDSSEEDATSKELQMSVHPGSLPDDYHDALDKFGKSLTDFHILKSETNHLHESKSPKDDARPLTTRSFTERKPISEKSLEESKQEPLHSAAASKEAKDLAEGFTTIEKSHRSIAYIAAPEVVGNLSTKDTVEATAAVAYIQREAKDSEITPAIETSTELAAITSSAVKDKEIMEHESTNVKYAKKPKITNADEQPSVSIPDLTEKVEKSETAPAISPATDIAANLPITDSKEATESTIETEKCNDESHTDQYADATKKGEARELESNNVNKEQLHSPPAIEEHCQETDPTLHTDGVTEIVESLATINGTNRSGVQDLKEPESRSIDPHETISYPSFVYQTEESHSSPVIVPLTKVERMFPTNNEAQTTDQPITTHEKHKEFGTTPDANMRTDEGALFNNAAREAEGLEHERNNELNAEQQSTLSPALEEKHDSQPCSDINTVKEIPEAVHRNENDWQATLVTPSEELNDQSHTAATETKLEEDAIAMNAIEKGDARELESNMENAQEPASLSVNKEQLHSPPAIEEQGQERDPTPDNDGVTETVENLATINETHISGVQDLKQPESRSIDQQETISYPSLVYQTEESCKNPVIVPVTNVDEMFPTNNEAQTTDLTITDEKHKESSRALDANVRSGEDALLINAAREAKGLENEGNNDKNAERTESKNSGQQSTLSPALEEYEDSQTCSDINATKEIPETVNRKENASEVNPMIPSEELHDQSHTATTETKLEEDATAINRVEKDEAMELESNVESPQEPASLCVNKEQLHSDPAIEEQGQETDPTLDTDGIPKIVENLANMNATHISGVQDLTEPESRSIDQQETISYQSLVYQTEESHRNPVIVLETKVDGMFATNNEAQTTDLTITTDERHKESSRALDANVRADEDALLINAAREAKSLENERNNDKIAEKTESTNAEKQSTLSPALEEHEDSETCLDINTAKEFVIHMQENAWEMDPIIPSGELHDQLHTVVTETKLEEDALAINEVENGEATELNSNNVENAQEPASLCVNKEHLHSPPAIEEQGQETDQTLDTSGVTEIVESLATINGTHISGVQDLKETESRSIDQQEIISYPSLLYQTEESHRSPIIAPVTKVDGMFPTNNEAQTTDQPITIDDKHKESSRAPDANVRTEEDALLINAARDVLLINAAREAMGLEHEKNNDKNAERTESTNAEQQSTLSPDLEEQRDNSQTCSDINAAKEIPGPVHRNKNAWEADPVITSEELHDELHTVVTEIKLYEDAIPINGVEKGDATELESNNVENAQEPANMCVNKEQLHSPAIEEQVQEKDPNLDTDGETEIVESLATINGMHTAVQKECNQVETCITSCINAIGREDVIATNIVAEDAKIMEFECKDVKKEKEHESTDTNKDQSVSSQFLKEKCYEANTAQAIYTAAEFVETIHTKDDAMGAKHAMIEEEPHEECNITSDRDATTEMDISTTDEVTENAKVVELESNGFETVKEPESVSFDQQQTEQTVSSPVLKENCEGTNITQTTNTAPEAAKTFADEQQNFSLSVLKECAETDTTEATGKSPEVVETFTDEQQSISSSVLKEKCEETDIAHATVTAQEAVDNFYTNDNAMAAKETVEVKDPHKEISMTLITNAITEAGAENGKKHENVDADDQQSVASPGLEENSEEIDTTQATDPAPEAVETFGDEQQKYSSLVQKECEETDTMEVTNTAPEAIETFADEQQSISSSILKENCEETDIAQAIDTAPEAVENVYANENPKVAKETMAEKEPHKESNRAPDIHALTEDKGVEHESDNGKNTEKTEATGADEQPSTLSPALEEQHEDPQSSQYINAAIEVPETLNTWYNASEADLILATTELHRISDTTSDRKIAADVTASNEVAERKLVEAKSNEEGKAEPESKYVDKQQSHSPVEEQVKESDLAPTTNAVKEITENLPMMDENTTAVKTEYHHKDSSIALPMDLTKDEDVLANKIAVKVAELEHTILENEKKNENADADADEQQSIPSPVLKINCEETDITQATDTAPEAAETIADEQQNFSSPVLKECKETDTTEATDTAPEVVETFADEQQSISSSILKENCEETDITHATVTAQEAVDNFYTNDNAMAAKETVEAKDPHKEISMTLITNAITEACAENGKKHENVDADDQQSVASPGLEENSEEIDTTQATDPAPEAVETFGDEQQKFPSSVLKECEETDTTEVINTAPEAIETFSDEQQSISSSILKENCEETGIAQATDTATEADENVYANENPIVAKETVAVKEPHKESSRAPANDAITENKGVEQENDNGENTESTEATGADEQPSTLSSALEEHEDPQSSQYINSATEVPKTLNTWDNASEADLILATKELHRHSDTTSDRKIAVDVTASNEVAERNLVEAKSNEEGKAEPESKYVDKQQSHSPVEEQVKESDLAPTTNAVKEIAENLPMMDESTTAVQTEYHHKDSNISLPMDLTKDEDVLANNIAVKVAELEHKILENEKKNENADADADANEQQSIPSPVLKINCEETDITQATDTAPEAAETIADEQQNFSSSVLKECKETDTTEATDTAPEVVETFADEQQSISSSILKENCEETDIAHATVTAETIADEQQNFSSSVLKECKETDTTEATDTAPEVVETFADEQQSISSSILKENCEETDIAHATVTAQEAVDNFYTNDNAMAAKETVEAKDPHKEISMTLITNAITEAGAENGKKHENVDADDQQSVASPGLEENSEEIDTTQATDPAPEAVETFGDEQQKFPSSVLKECEETDTTEVINTTPEAIETFSDQQQSIPSSILKENCEETSIAQATDTATEADENVYANENPIVAKETVAVKEPHKESSRAPANDAITENKGVEQENDNGENTESTEATGADEQPSTLSSALEEHEDPQSSQYINSATEVPKTLNTWDNASEADLILATKELHRHSDTTSDRKIAVDVTANNEVAKRNLVEAKSNEEGKAEPESKYVDKQQSHSPVEEQVKESDLAPTTNAVKEIAENLPMMDESTTAVQTEYHHKDSNIALPMDLTKDEDVLANNIAVKVAEHEHKILENEKKNENADADADEQQSIPSPVLKINCEETDITQATDTAPEAAETIADEQQNFSSSVLKECKETDTTEATDTAPEVVETFADEQQSISSSILKENCEETDIAHATVTAQEAVDNFYTNDNAMAAKETVEVKDPHKEISMTLITNAITEAGAENGKKHENVDADDQQSVASPGLEENSEEIDTTQATDPAPEAVETFGDEQQKYSSLVQKECEETDTIEVTNTAPEAIETFAGEQQSISSSTLKENCEETDIAQAIDTAPEAVENVYENENPIVAKETMAEKEPHKESNRAPDIHALTEDKGVEHESDNGKNTEKTEATGADEQPSTLSPALEEQHEDPQSSQYINAAIEVPETLNTWYNASEADLILATTELHRISDTTSDRKIAVDITANNEVAERKVVEAKSNEEEKAEEQESKYVDKQQSHSLAAMEEQVEESDLAHTTNAVKETAENLRTMDESTTSVQTEYHHKDSNIALPMDSTKDEDVLTNSIAVKVVQVAELEHNVAEIEKKHENAGANEQQSVSSPLLKENFEETNITQATDTATEASETFADEQQNFSSSVLKECEETDTTEATDTAPEVVATFADEQQCISSSVLKENCEEIDIAHATVTAEEAVENFYTNDNAMAAKETVEVKDPQKEINMTLITNATTEARAENEKKHENVDADDQQSVASPVLEGNSEEIDTTEATDPAPEAVETFGDEPQKISSSVLKECEETDTTKVTNTAPEAVETFDDEQQSISSSILKENCEETDIAQANDAAPEAVENVYANENPIVAKATMAVKEPHKESSRAPANDAITEEKGVEHESDHGENTEKTEATGSDEQPSTLSPALEEQHEDPQSSQYLNAAIKVPKTLNKWDNALEADLILATKELHRHSDTTSDRKIAVSVTASNEVAESKVVEVKSNEEEKAEEPESKYVDKQQLHSPTAMEEQVEESDLAPTTNAVKEIAENLHVMDESTTAVQTEYHHKDSNIALPMDSTKNEDVLDNNIAVKVVEVVELEQKLVENEEKHENADAYEQQSVSSPVLKEKCEETDITQATDTAPEAAETFADEQQNFSSPVLKECEETDTTQVTDTEPEVVETFADEQKSISSSVLKENCEEQEAAKNVYTNDNAIAAKETVEVKYTHKEIDMTLITNATTEEAAENEEKQENVEAADQPSLASPVLEENSEEMYTTQATDPAPEAVETFGYEKQKISSSVLKECGETDTTEVPNTAPEAVETFVDEQQSISSSILKENSEETGIAQANDTAPDVAETFADEQKSISSSVLKENCEETDIAHATFTAQEAVENFYTNDNAMAAEETVEVKDPHKEISMTLITNATTEAGAENEEKHENVDADDRQSLAAPVLEENSEEIDKTQATDPAPEAVETFGDEQQTFSSSVLKECGQTDTTKVPNTAPEAVETFADEQQSISSSILKENCEETDIAQGTDTAPEDIENVYANENPIVAKETMAVKEPHKDFSRGPAIDAITEYKGVEHESDNGKNTEKTEATGADEQPSTLYPALEEQHEDPQSSQYINAAIEVPKALNTWDNASEADLILATKELHRHSDTTSDRKIAVDVTASNEVSESKVVEAKSNEEEKAEESESKCVDKQQSHSPTAMEEQVEESDLAPTTNAVKEIAENLRMMDESTTAVQKEYHHKDSNVALPMDSTKDEVVELEHKVVENKEKHENADADEQQSVSSPDLKEKCEETDITQPTDAALEAAETFADEQQNFSSSVLRECVETDITEVTDTAPEVVETFADEQQSISSSDLKENCEETDRARATVTQQEAVENFYTNDNAMAAKETVEVKDPHKEINMTLITNATTEAGAENEEKHENVDADDQQSLPSPVFEENSEEMDTTQATDPAPEAVETFSDEQQKFSSSVLKECEAPEVVETFADEQQSISSSDLKENCEETDRAHATVTAQEAVENFYTNDNAMAETVEVKDPHKEINMTLITNATTEAGAENEEKHENVDADDQQSLASPVLEENSEEMDTTQATDPAPEAVETFSDEQQKFSSSVLKECEETDTTEVTNRAPEAIETFADEQQSISSSIENCDETDIAEATDTAPEAVENVYAHESPIVAKETMAVKEPHKEFNVTHITNATTEAGVENEKKNENADADERQIVSSPFLKENCQVTDTTQATDAAQVALETFADGQQNFLSSLLKESEQTNTSEASDTAPEAVETFVDEHKSVPSSVLKEHCKATNIAQDTDTTSEAVESSYANENAMVAKETMAVKEPHKEFNMTLITNATRDEDVPTMDEAKENAKAQELENSSSEIIKEPESRCFDLPKSFLSSALEEEHEESHTCLVNSGSTEIVGILPTKNDAHTADLMMPTEERHKQSNKAPATDVTIEADSLLINAVTGDAYVGHENSNVEKEKEMITTGPHEQQSTLSAALEEQHAESESSPAIKEVTEIHETIDRWDAARTQMIQSEQHHQESDTTSPHETTGIDVTTIKALADDEVVELESNKVEKADEQASIYVEKKQAHSLPTRTEQDEESNPTLATNAAIEILRNHHTKDVAQTTDPTASSEQQLKGSDKTPVSDATIEDFEDVQHIKVSSKVAQSMGFVTKNIDIAECPDTDASKQQTASFPTLKEECEESDIVSPNNATTQSVDTFDSRNGAEAADPIVPREEKEKEPDNIPTAEETRDNDAAMGTITEVMKVGELESSDVENLEGIDSTGTGQQCIILSSALEAETEAYTFPSRSAATDIAEALPTGKDAKKADLMVQTKEQQKESESTIVIDAPKDTGAIVVDAVLDDKVVEQESNNIERVEEGESMNVYEQKSYLFPVREEHHEESQIMSDTNALTEIAQTHYTRDKAQITDPIALSEEYQASHTTPATDLKTAIDEIAINSITVSEAVQRKGSNLENAEEPENEIADEQQRVSSQALEEKSEYPNTAKPTIETMEIDDNTGTRNNAQTEEIGAPTENFDISENNTEAEVLAMGTIAEDATIGIFGSTTAEIAEANSTDANQLSVLCQDVEEHLAVSTAVSLHCEIKEIADALLTRENTWTIDETVPIEEKHEKTDISPAIKETKET